MKLNCKNCNKSFDFTPHKKNPNTIRQSCSTYCASKIAQSKINWKIRNEKIRQSKLGANNPNWAGDKVGLEALHNYIQRRLPKPEKCESCQTAAPFDLANKGVYNRELYNWEWLCRKCHMESDGRIERLVRGLKGRKRDWHGRYLPLA